MAEPERGNPDNPPFQVRLKTAYYWENSMGVDVKILILITLVENYNIDTPRIVSSHTNQ